MTQFLKGGTLLYCTFQLSSPNILVFHGGLQRHWGLSDLKYGKEVLPLQMAFYEQTQSGGVSSSACLSIHKGISKRWVHLSLYHRF